MTDDRVTRGLRRSLQSRMRTLSAIGLASLTLSARSLALAVTSLALASASLTLGATTASARANPFAVRGMWIWYVSQSDGGNLTSIIADAHTYGIGTLLIKSGDGTGAWSQFNSQLVSTLHAAGLKLCAWQYVYGDNPTAEAQVGAQAVTDGADCLAIDAESEYEGKYVSAQLYIQTLRQLIGQSFPVALASFPYVDYHPSFPYSVFLGPGGAQYDEPQMYWVDIGTSVDNVYAHTYEFNSLYGRPIAPLGQLYDNPPAGDVLRFRQLARAYGAPGVSWWDWQTTSAGWGAISQPVGNLAGFTPSSAVPALGLGAHGDQVVWAQEHLFSAGQPITIDGDFGPQTQAAVQSFQVAHGIPTSAIIDAATWRALLRYQPVPVTWTANGALAGAPPPLVVNPPSLTVAPAPNGSVQLSARPGAITGIASWRALGGTSPSELISVATARSQGTETQITVGSEFPYFAVQALGSTGQVLGSSQAVATPAHLVIYGRSVFVSAAGVGGLPVGCFTGGACHITTTIVTGRTTIASTGREAISAGGVVHFALTARGRSLLARAHRRRLAVQATTRDATGATASVPVTLIPFATRGRAPRRSVTQSPTLQIIGTSDFAFADRVGGILAGCFASAPCSVRTVLSAGRTLIAATGPEILGANELGYMIFHLTAAGQSLLQRARGNQLGVKVTLTDASATARANIALVGFQ